MADAHLMVESSGRPAMARRRRAHGGGYGGRTEGVDAERLGRSPASGAGWRSMLTWTARRVEWIVIRDP